MLARRLRYLDRELVLVRGRALIGLAVAACVAIAVTAGLALHYALAARSTTTDVRAIECGRTQIPLSELSASQTRRFEVLCGVRLVKSDSVLKVVGPGD